MEAASLTLVKALEAVISVVAVTGRNSQGEYRLEGEAMDHVRLARLQVERAEKVIAGWQENRLRTRGDREWFLELSGCG
jgi:hypothetical protein